VNGCVVCLPSTLFTVGHITGGGLLGTYLHADNRLHIVMGRGCFREGDDDVINQKDTRSHRAAEIPYARSVLDL